MLIDALNTPCEEPVIKTKHSGQGGGGAGLKPCEDRVIEQYRAIEVKARAAVVAELASRATATAAPKPEQ